MVRSILFTGDCAAARAVHEKKLDERRQRLAAGSDPDPNTPAPSDATRSNSNLRKAVGTRTYAASAHPLKSSINEYLASLAQEIVPTQREHAWVLALETRDLLTVSSLGTVGFRAHHIVVPNPNREEVDAMRGA
jgi:hypothetical protein